MSSTDKIYHGCATRHSGGARLLVDFAKGEKCICATFRTKHYLKRLHPDKKLNKKETCESRTY